MTNEERDEYARENGSLEVSYDSEFEYIEITHTTNGHSFWTSRIEPFRLDELIEKLQQLKSELD